MKKKVLAWTAAVLIVAAVSACFLRPAARDLNPDFGYADKVFVMGEPEEIPITDCTGDTDVVRAVSFIRGIYGIGVRFEFDRDLAFTAGHYVEGEYVDGDEVSVVVEWLNGDDWVEIEEYVTDYAKVALMVNWRPYRVLLTNYPDELQLITFSRYRQPGKYRFTYTFRDAINIDDRNNYTTGDEVYTISHTYTAPEKTDKPFDLIAVSFNDNRREGFDVGYVGVDTCIRVNGYGELFVDYDTMKLEVRDGLKWVDGIPISERAAYRYLDAKTFTHATCHYLNRNAEYRLTFEFVEHEDGSGERYTLQIRFKFAD